MHFMIDPGSSTATCLRKFKPGHSRGELLELVEAIIQPILRCFNRYQRSNSKAKWLHVRTKLVNGSYFLSSSRTTRGSSSGTILCIHICMASLQNHWLIVIYMKMSSHRVAQHWRGYINKQTTHQLYHLFTAVHILTALVQKIFQVPLAVRGRRVNEIPSVSMRNCTRCPIHTKVTKTSSSPVHLTSCTNNTTMSRT